MIMQQSDIKAGQAENFFNLRDLMFSCLDKWHWFVITLGVALGIATYYLLSTSPVYTRTASVLIKEDGKGKSLAGDISSTFSDMGLVQTSSNVNNELIAFRSPSVMKEVVRRLNLDMNYSLPGRFHDVVAYGSNLPVKVTIGGLDEKQGASFRMTVSGNGAVTL
ncbi:protein containing Lipopolysaccharide biosynthesis domain protein, partial [gut metagenome]